MQRGQEPCCGWPIPTGRGNWNCTCPKTAWATSSRPSRRIYDTVAEEAERASCAKTAPRQVGRRQRSAVQSPTRTAGEAAIRTKRSTGRRRSEVRRPRARRECPTKNCTTGLTRASSRKRARHARLEQRSSRTLHRRGTPRPSSAAKCSRDKVVRRRPSAEAGRASCPTSDGQGGDKSWRRLKALPSEEAADDRLEVTYILATEPSTTHHGTVDGDSSQRRSPRRRRQHGADQGGDRQVGRCRRACGRAPRVTAKVDCGTPLAGLRAAARRDRVHSVENFVPVFLEQMSL